MMYYKCLSADYHTWRKNKVYSADSMDYSGKHNLAWYVNFRPKHWLLIIDDYEVY